MPFLTAGADGKYLGMLTSVELQNGDDESVRLKVVMGIFHQWNPQTQEWENVMSHDYSVGGWITLKSGKDFNNGQWYDKTVNVLAQVYDWYSADMDDLLQLISDSGEFIMGTVVTKGDFANLKYIDVPREKPGAGGGNKTDPLVASQVNKQYKSEIKAMIKKPTAPVTKFKPKQPEPGSQPWDSNTPAKPDNVPF